MNEPFFRDPRRVQALLWNAQDWYGTPFAWNEAVKGAGVDCVRLAWAMYHACGLFEEAAEPNFPRYRAGEDGHSAACKVNRWLEGSPHFEAAMSLSGLTTTATCEGWPPVPGDLVTFTIHRVPFHVGVMLTGTRFVHVLSGLEGKVIESDLNDDTWFTRLSGIWRPVGN